MSNFALLRCPHKGRHRYNCTSTSSSDAERAHKPEPSDCPSSSKNLHSVKSTNSLFETEKSCQAQRSAKQSTTQFAIILSSIDDQWRRIKTISEESDVARTASRQPIPAHSVAVAPLIRVDTETRIVSASTPATAAISGARLSASNKALPSTPSAISRAPTTANTSSVRQPSYGEKLTAPTIIRSIRTTTADRVSRHSVRTPSTTPTTVKGARPLIRPITLSVSAPAAITKANSNGSSDSRATADVQATTDCAIRSISGSTPMATTTAEGIRSLNNTIASTTLSTVSGTRTGVTKSKTPSSAMLTAGLATTACAKGTRPSSNTSKAYLLGRPLPPTPDSSPANFSHLASLSPLPPAGARPPLDNGSIMTSKKPTLSTDNNRGPSATCVAKSSSILSKLEPPASAIPSAAGSSCSTASSGSSSLSYLSTSSSLSSASAMKPLPLHRLTYNSDRNGFISSQRPAKHQTPSMGPTATIFPTTLVPIPIFSSSFAFRDSLPSSSSSAAPAPPPASIMVSPHDSPSVLVVKSQSKRRSYISSVVTTLTTNRKAIGHSSSLSALNCICGSKCDAIFDEMSRNLNDAVIEYSECIWLSKGACGGEVKKPDNPPENARLQRLWFHALDMKDYMGMLEGYIDELEGSLKEYVCTRMKQRDLVELERTRLQCELEVVKTRTALLGRWR